jgi:uncharacterized repeat protein (TIGR01451 family)
VIKAKNTASCTNTQTTSAEQLCQIDQTGGTNKITANLTANLQDLRQTGDLEGRIDQTSEQRFRTNQTGDSNELIVNGDITHAATSSFDFNDPVAVEHTQRTLQYSENNMNATALNKARFNLQRDQSSIATGALPVQRQDDTSTDNFGTQTGGSNGRAEVRLNANSNVNDIDIRGTDVKSQEVTSVESATQIQGYEDEEQEECFGSTLTRGGGILGCLLVDSGSQNPNGDRIDLDIGNPDNDGPDPNNPNDPTTGLLKQWTQSAQGPGGVGQPLLLTQDQSDKLPLIPIGSSPFTVQSNSRSILVSDEEAHMLCDASADGHAKQVWRGRLFCNLTEGGQDPIIVDVPFSGQTIHKSIRCELNADNCPTALPAAEASMDVRNMNEDYDGDAMTSVEQGQDFEYKSSFRNSGPGTAKNAALTVPIPANTTFVGCPEGCDGQPSGGSVTWNLGDVSPGGEVTKTLQLKVNADAPTGPGNEITNSATGSHDGANAGDPRVTFDSNATTVLVTAAPIPPREIVIDVLEQTINGTKPKNGVANVVINDTTVIWETVCFGDLDDGQCTTGTSLGIGNFDTDPEQELKMKFYIRDTGLDPNSDTRACLTGQTTNGETVHGCDNVTVI